MKIARGPDRRAIPIQDDTRYRAAGVYWFTSPAVIVLLIACVNVRACCPRAGSRVRRN